MPMYTLQQRIFMYDSYVITLSCREVVRRFQVNYPGMRVPSREAICLLVNKFRETGSILDKKRNVKRRVLTGAETRGNRSKCWPRLHALPPAKSYSKLTVYNLMQFCTHS